jgi:hypothetical protein
MAEPQVRPREPQTGATGDDPTTMHAESITGRDSSNVQR